MFIAFCTNPGSSGGGDANNQSSSPDNGSLQHPTISFSYVALSMIAGSTALSGVPMWQYKPADTIVYAIAASPNNISSFQDGSTKDAPSISIDIATGIVTVADSATTNNAGSYTVTATVTRNYCYHHQKPQC